MNTKPCLLGFAAFLVGAVALIVETLGPAILYDLNPGSEALAWSAMITVTLLALAVGYMIGGQLADVWPRFEGLFAIIGAAGVAAAFAPALKPLVVASLTGLTPPLARSIAAALLLFFPSLALLGGAAPFIMRLAAPQTDRIGKTSGRLSAVSTLGSLTASVGTGLLVSSTASAEALLRLAGSTLAAMCILAWGIAWLAAGHLVGARDL